MSDPGHEHSVFSVGAARPAQRTAGENRRPVHQPHAEVPAAVAEEDVGLSVAVVVLCGNDCQARR